MRFETYLDSDIESLDLGSSFTFSVVHIHLNTIIALAMVSWETMASLTRASWSVYPLSSSARALPLPCVLLLSELL